MTMVAIEKKYVTVLLIILYRIVICIEAISLTDLIVFAHQDLNFYYILCCLMSYLYLTTKSIK